MQLETSFGIKSFVYLFVLLVRPSADSLAMGKSWGNLHGASQLFFKLYTFFGNNKEWKYFRLFDFHLSPGAKYAFINWIVRLSKLFKQNLMPLTSE